MDTYTIIYEKVAPVIRILFFFISRVYLDVILSPETPFALFVKYCRFGEIHVETI